MNDMQKNKYTKIELPTEHITVNELPLKIMITHIAWKKDWWRLTLVAICASIGQYLTSFVITEVWGFVIGMLINVGIFFLGLWAITKIETKEIRS